MNKIMSKLIDLAILIGISLMILLVPMGGTEGSFIGFAVTLIMIVGLAIKSYVDGLDDGIELIQNIRGKK